MGVGQRRRCGPQIAPDSSNDYEVIGMYEKGAGEEEDEHPRGTGEGRGGCRERERAKRWRRRWKVV